MALDVRFVKRILPSSNVRLKMHIKVSALPDELVRSDSYKIIIIVCKYQTFCNVFLQWLQGEYTSILVLPASAASEILIGDVKQ